MAFQDPGLSILNQSWLSSRRFLPKSRRSSLYKDVDQRKFTPRNYKSRHLWDSDRNNCGAGDAGAVVEFLLALLRGFSSVGVSFMLGDNSFLD